MIGSSWPMIASTFWKKTIQGAILCDQPTCFDSSSCSRKLPAVWKNFFGTIGGRSRAPASGRRSPVSAAPPRSNHSRIVGTSRTTISSPSTRPDPSLVERHEPSHATTSSGVPVRREDRVEDLLDPPAREDERDAAVQLGALELERRQPERVPEAQLRVGDHRVEQAEPLRELDLLLQRLRREARRAARPAAAAPRDGRGTRTTAACSRARRGSRSSCPGSRARAGRCAGRRRARRARTRARPGRPARATTRAPAPVRPCPRGARRRRRRPAPAGRRAARSSRAHATPQTRCAVSAYTRPCRPARRSRGSRPRRPEARSTCRS